MFTLTSEELTKLREWEGSHTCILRDASGETYVGAIGGSLTYTFTPTGIGTITKVSCECGSILDLTDYNF